MHMQYTVDYIVHDLPGLPTKSSLSASGEHAYTCIYICICIYIQEFLSASGEAFRRVSSGANRVTDAKVRYVMHHVMHCVVHCVVHYVMHRADAKVRRGMYPNPTHHLHHLRTTYAPPTHLLTPPRPGARRVGGH